MIMNLHLQKERNVRHYQQIKKENNKYIKMFQSDANHMGN